MKRNKINYNKLAKATKKKTTLEKIVQFTALSMVLVIVSSIIISLFISLSNI